MPSDQRAPIAALEHKLLHKGMVWDLVSESFDFSGEVLTREFVDHPGAVAVLAINEKSELLLLKQYRHPVGSYLMELPAGLRDVAGESLLDCAKRELAEEAGLEASNWSELISFHTSPGGNSETITVFVATGLSDSSMVYEQTGEEKDMPKSWVEVAEVVQSVLNSECKSPSLAVGIMAYALKNGIAVK
jgi:8-oxo-dGDP phosphatase